MYVPKCQLWLSHILLNSGIDETGYQLLDQADAGIAQRALLLLRRVRPHASKHVDPDGIFGGGRRADRKEGDGDDDVAAHFVQLTLDLNAPSLNLAFLLSKSDLTAGLTVSTAAAVRLFL